GLVRLLECSGTLRSPPPAAASVLLSEDFAALPASWSVMTDQKHPLVVEEGALQEELGREGARTFLTLTGKGALYRVVPIEPDTGYAFTGSVRARGIVPKTRPFNGASLWLGEHFRPGGPAEIYRDGGNVDRRHPLPGAEGREGWQDERVVFRS